MFFKFTYEMSDDEAYGTMQQSFNKVDWTICGRNHFEREVVWPEWKKRQKAAGVIFEVGEPPGWHKKDTIVYPECSPTNDPDSAIIAANSPEALVKLNRSIARCEVTIHRSTEANLFIPAGLTNYETVYQYAQYFPEELDHEGWAAFSQSVMRSYNYLKPNKPRNERLLKNLGLIIDTGKRRKNPNSGKPNAIFNFEFPPSIEQIKEFYALAETPDRKRRKREI